MRPGPQPAPRKRLSKAFRVAIRREMESGTPAAMLARLAGFPNAQDFSSTIQADSVKGTAVVLARLHDLADLLGVPVDSIFND
jgi:hypothetical protein